MAEYWNNKNARDYLIDMLGSYNDSTGVSRLDVNGLQAAVAYVVALYQQTPVRFLASINTPKPQNPMSIYGYFIVDSLM